LKFKKTLFITIVLLVILSLGAVSAEDNGTDDVISGIITLSALPSTKSAISENSDLKLLNTQF
jgi:hypothetical protein